MGTKRHRTQDDAQRNLVRVRTITGGGWELPSYVLRVAYIWWLSPFPFLFLFFDRSTLHRVAGVEVIH